MFGTDERKAFVFVSLIYSIYNKQAKYLCNIFIVLISKYSMTLSLFLFQVKTSQLLISNIQCQVSGW